MPRIVIVTFGITADGDGMWAELVNDGWKPERAVVLSQSE
jgi:hypothetical protein